MRVHFISHGLPHLSILLATPRPKAGKGWEKEEGRHQKKQRGGVQVGVQCEQSFGWWCQPGVSQSDDRLQKRGGISSRMGLVWAATSRASLTPTQLPSCSPFACSIFQRDMSQSPLHVLENFELILTFPLVHNLGLGQQNRHKTCRWTYHLHFYMEFHEPICLKLRRYQ